MSDNPEYLVIQHLSGPKGDRLKEFTVHMDCIWHKDNYGKCGGKKKVD